MNKYMQTINTFFNITFIFNVIYDILCCIYILNFPDNKLAHIHSSIFYNEPINSFTKRIFAYWILTYSFPRLISGFYRHPLIKISCAITYFVEGISYHTEFQYYKSANINAIFVAYFSYILGLISLIQACNYFAHIENIYLFNILIFNSLLWYFGIYYTIQ